MSDVIPLSKIWLIISGIYVVSLIISLVFILKHVDCKESSLIIVILCIIYVSLFIFLNIIAVFDLFLNNNTKFEKLLNVISKFYSVFYYIDKILGFAIFNILIYYLESGYYSIGTKLLDSIFIRNFKDICTCKFLVPFGIIFTMISVILALLIIYRDNFGLDNLLDYADIILDYYSIFEIYTGVGFFIFQLIIDCYREKKDELKERYYTYSETKIINKTKKYTDKIKQLYNILNEASPSFENNNSTYNIYLQEYFKEVKNKMKEYGLEGNNSFNNNNKNNSFEVIESKSNLDVNKTEGNILNNNLKQNNTNIQIELNNKIDNKGEQIQNKETNEKEKEKEDLPTCIRKYKKVKRRIIKLQKLYKEFEKDKGKNNINNYSFCSCCSCFRLKYIFYVALFIVFLTDFLVPIAFNFDDDFYDKSDFDIDDEKENIISLALSFVLLFIIFVICCAYTIITVFSTIKKRYITGDFLSDRKINDNLNLLKTVQLVCGFSYALVYCNLYFWKIIDRYGHTGKPLFYENIIVPDLTIKQGISVYMIAKIVVIIISIIMHLKCSSFFIYKNDLADYNLSCICSCYSINDEKNLSKEEEKKIINILNKYEEK